MMIKEERPSIVAPDKYEQAFCYAFRASSYLQCRQVGDSSEGIHMEMIKFVVV